MVDIARPPSVIRKKKIRRAIYGAVALIVVAGITVGVSRLKPAAPTVDRATVWVDTVKRGQMLREVRGSGTLVPEDIRWISATTAGRVQRIVLRAGAIVEPNTVILELSSPDVEQANREAQLAYQSALAAYENRKADLESALLTQESNLATIKSNYTQADLDLQANKQLEKDGLVSSLLVKQKQGQVDDLRNRLAVETKRLEISKAGIKSQLAPQEADIAQRKAAADLQARRLDDLKVKAGMHGVLQCVCSNPTTQVERGAQVNPGSNLARVADPSMLKAELRIAETQTKDIRIGQYAEVDTRNGVVKGKVARIDPASSNGTVGVDITLEGALPSGARPDLSVDGKVRLEELNNIIYVGRPAFGQENSSVSLFKVGADGEAVRTTVKLGRSSVNTIEIVEGLQPGDQVILSDMSTYDEYQRVRLSS
ncbi:MAG TPA: HlyD family efflux transporter periplasmic adaptor subunit [Vicinamibacterales bacterium]|nr:HlyD family efflux transporter periplasmic adaptor subunit [Vicinamibacterales bacterium]